MPIKYFLKRLLVYILIGMGVHDQRTDAETRIEKELNRELEAAEAEGKLAPLALVFPLSAAENPHSERDWKFCVLVGICGSSYEAAGRRVGLQRNASYTLGKKLKGSIEIMRARLSCVSKAMAMRNNAVVNSLVARELNRLTQSDDPIPANVLLSLAKICELMMRSSVLLDTASQTEAIKPHREKEILEIKNAQKELEKLKKSQRAK